MTDLDLFHQLSDGSSPFYQLCYDSKDDYYSFVHKKVNEYFLLLRDVDKTSLEFLNSCLVHIIPKEKHLARPLDIINDTKLVIDMVEQVIALTYKGLFSEAFCTLEEFFIKDNCHNAELLPMTQVKGYNFYRMRKGTIAEKDGHGEMFHIPFDNRRYSAHSERYSAPGYPCLYLGGSLLTAWREMGSPDEDITYCLFKFKDEYDDNLFIDIGYPTTPNPTLPDLYSFFMYFPLYIACSVAVNKPDQEYKPEYLFPQMMLEFVRYHVKNGIIGISFISTKNTDDSVYSFHRRNFVIPTFGADADKGYDLELANHLLMTPFVNTKGTILANHYKRNESLFSLTEKSIIPDLDFKKIIL